MSARSGTIWLMHATTFFAVALLLSPSGPAQAADICQATALRDVPAIESPESIIKKGGIDEAITQYRVDKTTGQTSFCSHGGYCYPTHVIVGGGSFEALRMTNCKIGGRVDEDKDEVTYTVDTIRSKIPAAQLQIDDLDNRLLQLDLCSACAGNAATIYVQHPKSQCAVLTRKALEGDPEALSELQSNPAYCRL